MNPARLAPREVRAQIRKLQPTVKRLVAFELRRGREIDGLTQDELADICGVHRQVCGYWEQIGKDEVPNAYHVERASRAGALHWALAAARCQVPGCQVLPMPRVVDEPESARTARVVRELLDVVRVRTEDGASLSKAERELVETREAMRVLSEHEAFLCAALEKARVGR